MTVPPDTSIFRFIYWLVNTPGLGGLGVGAIILTCLASVAAALRWIAAGAQEGDPTTYAYPSPALLGHAVRAANHPPEH